MILVNNISTYIHLWDLMTHSYLLEFLNFQRRKYMTNIYAVGIIIPNAIIILITYLLLASSQRA